MKKRACLIVAILCLSALVFSTSAVTWVDISTPLKTAHSLDQTHWNPWVNCGSVTVNRLTGDVFLLVIGYGVWKSSDKAVTFTQVADGNTICTDGDFLVDQNNPVRMAVLGFNTTNDNGLLGYTLNGTTWSKFTNYGRGWEFGAVDWSDPTALKNIIVMSHESSSQFPVLVDGVFKSTDAGITWQKISGINMYPSLSGQGRAMLGAIDQNTYIYYYNDNQNQTTINTGGIMRTTDGGGSWTRVSTEAIQTRAPVLFGGKYYLGTSTGLLVSSDKGATWAHKGASTDVVRGPFFGADSNTIFVMGSTSGMKSTNGGTSWTMLFSQAPTLQVLWVDGKTYPANYSGWDAKY
ncbi:MAG: hypothetical protein PHC61_06050, partial [Chitinivibrionales bacterium]|nr:hypothetical protein [Chitinivibrionales bacterium]